MQRTKYDIWVGLFVMLGVMSIVFLALKVGNLVNLSFDKTYAFNAQFSNIGGVTTGSPVKSAGVVVGRVRRIVLDNQTNKAVATLEMRSGYDFAVDSTFRIVTSGLLGEEYIAISPGVENITLEQAVEQNAGNLLVTRTQPSIALGDLLAQILPGSDGNQPLTGRTYRVDARFGNIGTIRAGATVKSSGVLVGRVLAVNYDNHMYQAVVTLELESSFDFPSDSSLRIMSSGLIGGQYIDISPGIEEQTLEQAAREAQRNGEVFLVTQTQSAIVLEDLIGQFLYNAAGSSASNK